MSFMRVTAAISIRNADAVIAFDFLIPMRFAAAEGCSHFHAVLDKP
jgi:hypothetical protein